MESHLYKLESNNGSGYISNMRFLSWLAVIVVALPIPGIAQTARNTTIFTNLNGQFRFVYPKDSQICEQGEVDPCNQSFIPVCEPDVLVCVVYHNTDFKDTNFDVASFQVREISTEREMMTADVCVTPYPQKEPANTFSTWPEFLISAEHPVEIISGVKFVHGITGGAASGHWSSVDLYRAFQKKKCFELSVTETGVNPDIFDPPLNRLTSAQVLQLNHTMSDILHSFRFIN